MNSIEGNWVGEYIYGDSYVREFRGKSVKFTIDISLDGDLIKGTCVDEETKNIFHSGALIEGTFENGTIIFYKTYPIYLGSNEDDKLKAQQYYSTGSIQYIGTLKKKLFSNNYYFEGTWDINASFLDENGIAGHYSFDGTWKMKRDK